MFTSARLGFRNWEDDDVEPMANVNRDPEVMRFFPELQSLEETTKIISRFKSELLEKGHTYFAVDNFDDGRFIGFIGLHIQAFESNFTPCVDIGWRLDKEFWNKGYATEGATRCLQYAFDTLQMQKIVALAPAINLPSINVMKKIGMTKILDFKHPLLLNHPNLVDCELYAITDSEFQKNYNPG